MTSNPPTPPPSKFLDFISERPGEPIDIHLQPYLQYESQIRKDFESLPNASTFNNVASIYANKESIPRIVPRKTGDSDVDKYIMPLRPRCRPATGQLAVTPSIEEFKIAFDSFTLGCLRGLDWSNMVVAGSSVLFSLLPPPTQMNSFQLANHFQELQTASSSDIDIFLYGLANKNEALKKIRQIYDCVRKNRPFETKWTGRTNENVIWTKNAITILAEWPQRHIQIILRLYSSISEVLTGFDVDCACVAFDGDQALTTPRGATALMTRCNSIDITRRSPSYENRLYKYRNRGFETYWELMDRSRVQLESCRPEYNPVGLARLIFYEQSLQSRCKGTKLPRLLQWLLNSTDEHKDCQSEYEAQPILYGRNLTASGIIEKMRTSKRYRNELYSSGDIEKFLCVDNQPEFISDNPGCQGIGCFYPQSGDDWSSQAYSALGSMRMSDGESGTMNSNELNGELGLDQGDTQDEPPINVAGNGRSRSRRRVKRDTRSRIGGKAYDRRIKTKGRKKVQSDANSGPRLKNAWWRGRLSALGSFTTRCARFVKDRI